MKLLSLLRYYWYSTVGKDIRAAIWTKKTSNTEAFIFNNKDAADAKVFAAMMAGYDIDHTNGGRLHTVVIRPGVTPTLRRYPVEFSLN